MPTIVTLTCRLIAVSLSLGLSTASLSGCGSGGSNSVTPALPPPEPAAAFNARQAVDSLTAVLDAAVAESNRSAALLLVDLPRDDWRWQRAVGSHGLTGGVAASEHDSFRIASVTKPMTAVTVLRLAERGLLALDQPISELLDPAQLPAGRQAADLHGTSPEVAITVRHLLRHESGLADYLFEGASQSLFEASLSDLTDGVANGIAATQWQPQELLALYFDAGLPMLAGPAPGTAHRYSDTNYLLLGLIIEAVTGLDYATALRQEVFEPAGMTSSYLETRETARGMPLLPHYLDVEGIGNIDLINTGFNPSADWGGGGVVSTLADLHAFLRALFIDGSLLSPARQADLLEAVAVPDDLPGAQYGLGLEIATTAGVRYLGHTGFWGVFAYYLPDTDGILILVINQAALDRAAIDQAVFDALRDAGWQARQG